MKPLIVAKNLEFLYNHNKANEFHALINVSFKIYPDEFVIIYGPSGSGKSTLLNVIAGLQRPDKGSLVVADRDLMKMGKREFSDYHKRDVGMVYRHYNLIKSLTILDNIVLPQILISAKKKTREERALKLLRKFKMENLANKYPVELLGYQKQQIGLARAIANNPKIILADEPIGNLDTVSAKEMIGTLRKLNNNEKKTIIMTTHDLENLEEADRIIYMKDGIVEREVINKDKGALAKKTASPKAPSSEMKDMMQSYQGLTAEQISVLIMPYKAKVFTHHFITTRNMEETQIFEQLMQRRLLGAITRDEFFNVLSSNSANNGVGLDKRTAERVLKKTDDVIKIVNYIYQDYHQKKDENGRFIPVTLESKIDKLVDYLLLSCYSKSYKNLEDSQLSKIKELVRMRFSNEVDKKTFNNLLDVSIKEGGVGLNTKTAKAITEELELVLIIGVGIVQQKRQKRVRVKTREEMSNKEKDDTKVKEKENEKGYEGKIKSEVKKKSKEKDLKKVKSLISKKELDNLSREEKKQIFILRKMAKKYKKGSLKRSVIEEELKKSILQGKQKERKTRHIKDLSLEEREQVEDLVGMAKRYEKGSIKRNVIIEEIEEILKS